MLWKIKNGLKNLFSSSPVYEPISEFISPCNNMKMVFGAGWEWEVPRNGETTFVFFNNDVEGLLYVSVLSNQGKNYKYHPNKSLEINKDFAPILLDLTKYKAVLYVTEEKGSNVFYRHYEIGHNQTLARFSWMTPIPDDDKTNKSVESLFETIEIK
jgi:hypothetical protein